MSLQCGGRKPRFKMRISIREQLGLLIVLTALTALMVLALATWFQNYDFITDIRLSGLSLSASLKAAQVSSALQLYETQVKAVSTRVLIQNSLKRYNSGNDSAQNFVNSQADLAAAFATGNLLLQGKVFPADNIGNQTALGGLVNVTASGLNKTLQLPYNHPNGSAVFLGDPGLGYPPILYPNLTYTANTTTSAAKVSYQGRELDPDEFLFLGPLIVNESFALLSATTGIINNTSQADVLGWLTVLIDMEMIYSIDDSPEGLGKSGETLLVGPTAKANIFAVDPRSASRDAVGNQGVHFILPPLNRDERHSQRASPSTAAEPFSVSSFPAVENAWVEKGSGENHNGAYISTHNEQGKLVSAGYARVTAPDVDWVLVVELSHSEVTAPIRHLRNVVLICVFSVMGLLLVVMFPLAHYSITPIRHLRAATLKTVEPYQPEDGSEYGSSMGPMTSSSDDDEQSLENEEARKEGLLGKLGLSRSRAPVQNSRGLRRRRTFRIPSKVPERKHWVTDELTELTSTFNEMSDELTMQYERLEERVKERTAELERSKKAAEAANQSKTLFIANISHELKTPLNGILGLTTVCMNENDMSKVRSTLSTIYKSGDLLLHLLTDLLTFSKNEVGQQLSIDETQFRISDLSTQLMPTFEKQAREAQVNLTVLYLGTNDAFGDISEFSGEKLYGPAGTGRVKDMCLWGDKNRILQVLMNFVSNSLKFTPANGSVTVRIRCVGLSENVMRTGSARKSSMNSRKSKHSSSKKVRMSDTSLSKAHDSSDEASDGNVDKVPAPVQPVEESKLNINIGGGIAQIAKVAERRRSISPPPLNTKDLGFEFEVEDTGPGIPEDQQQKIFEPFVQGDLGLSKKYGGTGLGLSICAQLAALMGGNISLSSTVGQGSTFIMRIPLRYVSQRSPSLASSHRAHSKASSLVGQVLHDNSEPMLRHSGGSTTSLTSNQNDPGGESKFADVPRIVGFTQPYVATETTSDGTQAQLKEMKRAESEAAAQGKKVKVLVAEDNPVNQEVVLRMLKLEDVYDVTLAKDGQEAFDKVKESMKTGVRYDLVFMDVQMPNLDGIQSTKLIREMGFSAPIVALTAFSEKSNEDECMASGMDYFLAKPIRRPALKQVLKKFAPIPEEEYEGTMMAVPRVKDLRHKQPTNRTHSPAPSTSSMTRLPNGGTESGDVSPMS